MLCATSPGLFDPWV